LVLVLAVLPRSWTVHWGSWGRERQLLGLGEQGMELLHLAPSHCHFFV